ncbi:hypothetical protein N9165_02300 [Akkermansiaceae bacterium]|nr:hypothetical protein [Akkermansiaceae bacterium]
MKQSPKKIWKRRIVIALLVVAGSILILFPAWLPDNPKLPTEESAVEGLQVFLLLAAAAFWFGAAKAAGKLGAFYKLMGVGGIAAAMGEIEGMTQDYLPFPFHFLFIPAAIYVLVLFFKNQKYFPRFYSEFTSHPAAGFFASAFIMIYVLARFLGRPFLWKATLGANYHPDIPATVGGYLELLACYLLMVGTIGLCIREQDEDMTEVD